MPKAQVIRAVSETIVRVQFDESISGDPEYLNPDNYIFTGELEALGAVVYKDNTIDILTTQQETDQLYELEVKIG